MSFCGHTIFTMKEIISEMVSPHEALMRTEINYIKFGLDKRNETTIRGCLNIIETKMATFRRA